MPVTMIRLGSVPFAVMLSIPSVFILQLITSWMVIWVSVRSIDWIVVCLSPNVVFLLSSLSFPLPCLFPCLFPLFPCRLPWIFPCLFPVLFPCLFPVLFPLFPCLFPCLFPVLFPLGLPFLLSWLCFLHSWWLL